MNDSSNLGYKNDGAMNPMMKIMEDMMKQIQMLAMRVDTLERHLASITGGAAGPITMPILAASSTAANVGSSEVSPTGQLPSQNIILWQMQQPQQQQQQRDDAFMTILAAGSPTSMTPTNMGPMGSFPASMQHPAAVAMQASGGGTPSMMTPPASVGYPPQGFPSGAGFDPNSYNHPISGVIGTPSVQCTTLDPARCTNETLERVCQQQYLKELCLKGCKSITNFTPLMRLRNLWKLNLQGCSLSVDDNVVKLIATHNKRLSRLNLCGCERITNAASLSQLSFLFDLNLSCTQITNACLEAISSGCGQLGRLAINSCPNITKISCVSNLKELRLLYCRYSGNISPQSISDVLNSIGSGLVTLNVDGIKFPQLDFTHLPLNTALKNFNMKDNIEMTNLNWLTYLQNAPTVFSALEMIDVEGCASLASLGDISQLHALKVLRLTNTAIGQHELAKLAASPSLTTLYLDGCTNITSVDCLAELRTLNKLVLDQQFQRGNRAEHGLTALGKHGHIDITFAPQNAGGSSPSTHNHPSSNSFLPHGCASPFTTPTAYHVPQLPSSMELGVIGEHVNGTRQSRKGMSEERSMLE